MDKEELKARLRKDLYKKPGFWDKHLPKAFTGVGVLMLLISLGITISDFYFLRNSEKTTGVVIRLDGGSRRQGYAPVVEYSDLEQKVYTYYHGVFSRPPSYHVGELVDIYYKTNNPTEANMGYSLLGIGVTGGIGIVFLFFGFIFQKAFKF